MVAGCGVENEIKAKEPIRCHTCGHRIMYKKRTRRSTWCVQSRPRIAAVLTSLRVGVRGAGPLFTVVQVEAR